AGGPPHPARPDRVLAPGALHGQRAQSLAARRDLRSGVGIRLRSGLELARRVCRIPATKARAGRRRARDPDRAWRRLRDEGAMSFRLRVTLLIAAAVAVTAIGASVAMYFVVQNQLIEQVDGNLALAATRVRLAEFAGAAILLAATLGFLIGRAVLAPVKRLTTTVEEVTRTRDLSRRVAAHGRDELSRLGTSFDAMLGQLETSLRS